MKVGFFQSRGCAGNLMFSVVGAGLKRPPAVQTSEVRNQISDAVQAGFTRCNGFAVNRISYPVGAGLKRPPEQSSGRKQLVSVIKIVILISAVTDWKNQLSCGRAQRPAPTTAALLFRVATAVWNHPARILSAEYRPRLPWVFFPFSVFFECVIGDVIPSVLKLRLIADDSVVKAPLPKR